MARTVLLTLGRLPHAIDLARGFSQAGWRVLVAEPMRWHLTGMSRHVSCCFQLPAPVRNRQGYLDGLRSVIAREKVDLVVPVSEETMYVAAIHGEVPVFTVPQPRVLGLHDKQAFVAQAEGYGLAAPQTFALGDPRAAALAAQDYVVKPVFSCAGRGVRIFAGGAALPPPDPAVRTIVQAFVPGRLLSSCSIVQKGRVVAMVIYRALVFSGSVGVCFERLMSHLAAEAWVETFARASGHTGFLSFDFVERADGAVEAIECNPRLTSGIHFMEPADVVAAIVDPTAVGVRFSPEMRLQQFYAALTATQNALFRPNFTRNLRYLLTTRDVVWKASDPVPFATMMLTAAPIVASAIRHRSPLGEVGMLDVGWRG